MPRSIVRNWVGSLFLVVFGFLATLAFALAEEKRQVVSVAPIEGIIDLGLAPFVERVLDEAARSGRVIKIVFAVKCL